MCLELKEFFKLLIALMNQESGMRLFNVRLIKILSSNLKLNSRINKLMEGWRKDLFRYKNINKEFKTIFN